MSQHLLRFILWDVNSKAELFASSYVKTQAVVIWGGEEMDDSTEGAVWAGIWPRAPTFLHHHSPVNQIHPAQDKQSSNLSTDATGPAPSSPSPRGLLLGVADAGDFAHSSHHHPQSVVACQDLHCAAHGDALQADAIHLHQLVSDGQPSMGYSHRRLSAKQTYRVFTILLTCWTVVLHFADKYAKSMFGAPSDAEAQAAIRALINCQCV